MGGKEGKMSEQECCRHAVRCQLFSDDQRILSDGFSLGEPVCPHNGRLSPNLILCKRNKQVPREIISLLGVLIDVSRGMLCLVGPKSVSDPRFQTCTRNFTSKKLGVGPAHFFPKVKGLL
ncbi:hypothetical protein H6P81_010600 [Aristolochia fimbriata]|uniref:Uncharacterized protein n=1 Tax=Aristolochia fimbriata TaxID=158543 RepID=A0AAV7EP88_ARIFI|nr:hypothetical protein H6P81_010600 [Aristolochia fimbriata]